MCFLPSEYAFDNNKLIFSVDYPKSFQTLKITFSLPQKDLFYHNHPLLHWHLQHALFFKKRLQQVLQLWKVQVPNYLNRYFRIQHTNRITNTAVQKFEHLTKYVLTKSQQPPKRPLIQIEVVVSDEAFARGPTTIVAKSAACVVPFYRETLLRISPS